MKNEIVSFDFKNKKCKVWKREIEQKLFNNLIPFFTNNLYNPIILVMDITCKQREKLN